MSLHSPTDSGLPWHRLLLLLAVIGAASVGIIRQQQRAKSPLVSADVRRKTLYDCARDEPLPPAEFTTFVDATDAMNLNFVHAVGPLGTYYTPESVGSGGALCDLDNDGQLDLLLINSGKSPHGVGDFAAGLSLNNGLYQMKEGRFHDVTAGSGLEQLGYGMGCALGDVDNDGDVDLYVTAVGQDRLLLNQGNMQFVDVTREAGLEALEWGTGAAFLDYDRDGHLDLVVVNYARDDNYDFSVACGVRQGYVSYCGPGKFARTVDRLFHNDGVAAGEDGSNRIPHFSDVTESSGLGTVSTYGFAAVCADFTGDDWVDIYIANDAHPNLLWVNQKNGQFRDEAMARGVAVNQAGQAEGSMGIAVGDLDRNLSLDLVVTHLSGETTTLYLNDGSGHFTDQTDASRLGHVSRRQTGWGTALVDLDHDGNLDLPVVNGLLIPCHSGFPPHGENQFQVHREAIPDTAAFWMDYHDRNLLLLSKPSGRFRDVTTELGGDFTRAAGSGRSLIYGDPDEDGDLDLIVTNSGSRARYYRNDINKTGHWLRLRLLDPQRQRDALGAVVQIEAGDQAWMGVVLAASSYLASNDARVHFGLGGVTTIDRILVRWPDGSVESCREEFPGSEVDRDLVIERGQGKSRKEWK